MPRNHHLAVLNKTTLYTVDAHVLRPAPPSLLLSKSLVTEKYVFCLRLKANLMLIFPKGMRN